MPKLNKQKTEKRGIRPVHLIILSAIILASCVFAYVTYVSNGDRLEPGNSKDAADTVDTRDDSKDANEDTPFGFASGEITIESGDEGDLPLNNADYPVKHLTVESDRRGIVEIKKGLHFVAKRPGYATVTVTTKDGQTASIRVDVICERGLLDIDDLKKSYGIDACNKLMIVAHPDDETLWGGAHLRHDDWFILCLTNGNDKTRAAEFNEILEFTNNKGIIISYPDTIGGERNDWKTVNTGMRKDISLLVNYKKWDQIVTYNPDGVTGHIHHRLTWKKVRDIVYDNNLQDKLYYFGRFYKEGKIPSDLPRISDSDLEFKESAIQIYANEAKYIDLYWRQMLPYEDWIPAVEWEVD